MLDQSFLLRDGTVSDLPPRADGGREGLNENACLERGKCAGSSAPVQVYADQMERWDSRPVSALSPVVARDFLCVKRIRNGFRYVDLFILIIGKYI